MKIALVSDIHGNAPAFAAVAQSLPIDVDLVVAAGDLCGYYPFLSDCLTTWRALDIVGVRGNHDQVLLDAARGTGVPPEYEARFGTGLRRGLEALSAADLALLSSLPTRRELTVGGRTLVLVHGAPWDELEGRVYPDFDEWERFTTACDGADVVVLGHTHYPLLKHVGEVLVVNPGSVGQPRDRRGGACYAVLDTDAVAVEHHRIPYDASPVVEDARLHDPGIAYLTDVLAVRA